MVSLSFKSPGNAMLAKGFALALSVCLALCAVPLGARVSAAAEIEEITVPTANAGVLSLVYGPDGNMWFTEYTGNKIGKASVEGTVLHEYAVPTATAGPACMVVGPDGNMWFTEYQGSKIGKITPGGTITEYAIPTPNSYPMGICVGPDGNLWFCEMAAGKIGRITMTGAITEFPVAGAGPRAITTGPDGNLWFTDYAANRIRKMTPSGAVSSYPIPTADASPWDICMGPDGNLWFTEFAANKIGRCTGSGNITEYPTPTAGSRPVGIMSGPDGNLWFCEMQANRVGRCTTAGGITDYPVPTADSHPMFLANAPDGTMWFGGESTNKIGRIFGYETASWYLAEGSTAWGFSTYITIQNPMHEEIPVDITYMPTGSAPVHKELTLPAESQTTITNDNLVAAMGGQRDFSTRITCDEKSVIAVDRTMTWTGQGAPAAEAHSSIGVTSPARRWFLAEGSSMWGFETWLLIQNPTAYTATCRVTYMIEGEGPRAFTKKVEPNSRRSFNMSEDIGARDASIEVVSSVPVIPERAMYRHDRREGHDSIGTCAPALKYYLAEGTTAWGFTTYVLVQNPNDAPCDVTVTYQTSKGAKAQPPFEMPPNSRRTIRVNDDMPEVDLSTTVSGTLPIIAERAMYLGTGVDEVAHASIGFAATHGVFFLPDGQTTAGRETFILVQNPNPSKVEIVLMYLMENGKDKSMHMYTLAPNSRRTFPMYYGATGRGSAFIATNAGHRIMVERAMYWNDRKAATGTIGGYTY